MPIMPQNIRLGLEYFRLGYSGKVPGDCASNVHLTQAHTLGSFQTETILQ